MEYILHGKKVTRDQAQAYLSRLGYNPHLGREWNSLEYLESHADRMMKVYDNDVYSYLGLTIKRRVA